MNKRKYVKLKRILVWKAKLNIYAFYNSLFHFYSQIALWFATRQINIPGIRRIKRSLPPQARSEHERRVLIYQIKAERYAFHIGPLVIRKFLNNLNKFAQRNKFLLSILFKVIIGFVVIGIPIALFLLLRGVLPVPDRIPFQAASIKLEQKSYFKTSWPYTEAPFNNKVSTAGFNFVSSTNFRGVNITEVLEPNIPPGLIHFGVGNYPQKVTLMRGFLVGESSPIKIRRQFKIFNNRQNNNFLKIKFYLFPAQGKKQKKCQIQIADQNQHILASSIYETPQMVIEKQLSHIAKAWRLRFTPNYVADYGKIQEFMIDVQNLPHELIVSSSLVDDDQPIDEHESNRKHLIFHENQNDISNDECIFSVADFSFQHISDYPTKRRGVVFILVDTLREKTAFDKSLMPHLNDFSAKNSFIFREHRAQANMTVPSVSSLLTSRYPRDLGSVAFSYAAGENVKKSFYQRRIPMLGTSLQQLGYRVGAIGSLSLFSEALEGGVDFGFHNATLIENAEYEARQITEEALAWLENYGEAPFFLYLHYNTMHGPYKPPFEHISLLHLLQKPFGFHLKSQLYNALARYWDEEFLLLQKKLIQLGIYDKVDIVVTADHGMQIEPQPFHYFMGVDHHHIGSYADKGHTLFDEEIKVPLIVKIAQDKQEKIFPSLYIRSPSAHVDLFPTLYSFMGGKNPDKTWRGLNFASAFHTFSAQEVEKVLQTRNTIYFEGHRYAGIMHWQPSSQQSGKKYIKQLITDSVKLLTDNFPFQYHIKWFQAEQFSKNDLLN
ncbi:MAG: sulfatase-like hydrolase/transferase, partial [Silvanigrellaceae bacterium]|nr:sulfatase-like hydrolase/transferase [Silvanigrellaceae bacterium]